MRYTRWLFGLVWLILIYPAAAQNSCPTDILLALARTGSACDELARNTLCYGNGTVTVSGQAADAFELPGQRVNAGDINAVAIGGDTFSTAVLALQADIVSLESGRNLRVLAFGDATLINRVPVRPTVTLTATGTLNVRAAPNIESEILQRLPLRSTLTANGLTESGEWFRVELPGSSQVGWIARDVVTVDGNASALNIVDAETPYLRPFQAMQIETARDDAPCDGAPPSGVLLQSPNTTDPVSLTINNSDVALAGTVFLQAESDTDMTLYMLDGFARVRASGSVQTLPAGASLQIPLSAGLLATAAPSEPQPFSAEAISGLPVNNLSYRVRLPDPISNDELQQRLIALEQQPTPISTQPGTSPERCVRTARGAVTLYAGPGTTYEVIREIDSGTRLYPVLRLIASDGVTWWQLSNSHWLRADRASEDGNCQAIPRTELVQPPTYNVLTMETCDTSNGPLRAGQYVVIEFTAGSWRNQALAQRATRDDPGRITIDDRRTLYVRAGRPFRVAEERWYRVFSANWEATPGTHRIESQHLSYILTCDVTVPLG